MLRSLKEVQADDSIVGFYQAMTLGSFYNQTLVDTQAIQQEKLRHGGIVLVHGTLEFVYDQTSRSNCLRYRYLKNSERQRCVPRVQAN